MLLRTNNDSSFSLITTGKDCSAILWKIDPQQKLVIPMGIAQNSKKAIHAAAVNTLNQFAIGGWDNRIFIHSIEETNIENYVDKKAWLKKKN